MKKNMQPTGEVLSWNNDWSKRTPFPAKERDQCTIKVQGFVGTFNAKIVGFSNDKPNHVAVELWNYNFSQKTSRVRWVKKNSIHEVYPV